MPFKSEAQRRWMYSTHPAMAKRWEKDTPKGRKLPKRKRPVANTSGSYRVPSTPLTTTIRLSFKKDLLQRMRLLAKEIREYLSGKVVLNSAAPLLLRNSSWQPDQEQRVSQFKQWLARQVKLRLGKSGEEEWWDRYIQKAFSKGAAHIYSKIRKPGLGKEEHYQGAKSQFLNGLAGPEGARQKLKLLAAKTYTDMDEMTQTMSNKIVRAMINGTIQGKTNKEIAQDIQKQVGISLTKANQIARDAISGMYAEGQLVAAEQLGVEELGVYVEWEVSGLGTTNKGNPSPCKVCAPLANVVLKVKDAHGLFPRHPNCLCRFKVVKSKTKAEMQGKKRYPYQVQAALDKSILREGRKTKPTKTQLAKKRKSSHWAGAKLRIRKG